MVVILFGVAERKQPEFSTLYRVAQK